MFILNADRKEYALIYDFRVARSLIKLTTIPEVFEIVEITPSTKFKDYMKYNAMMHKWSKEMDTTAEWLEMFLFEYPQNTIQKKVH
ncbi:MAG: hypothetical protein WBA61_04155 [Aequorivita sp.]